MTQATSRNWKEILQTADTSVYSRLCSCANVKENLPILVNTRWLYLQESGKAAQGFTKEDALVQILEWLDSNHQWLLADIDRDTYNELIA